MFCVKMTEWQIVYTHQEQSDQGLHRLHMPFLSEVSVRNFRRITVYCCDPLTIVTAVPMIRHHKCDG